MFGSSLAVLLLSAAALVSGGRSPHADVVESLKNSRLGGRVSTDVYEDALLDVPGLVSKYGYPVECHTVTTSDGYVLTAHRIPRGRDALAGPKPVVFLMHGLLSSSADYVVLGPGNALAYLLADEGYDVWMGNARGNFYSRKHQSLNPDRSTNFWTFSWEEIGLYDLPAFIDYIETVTGEHRLHYVGHSQGGTAFLVLNSLRPEYNQRFKSFQGLAPASYFNNNQHGLFVNLARYEKIIETLALTLGIGEILDKEQAQALVTSRLCDDADLFDPVCVASIQANSHDLSGYNATMLPLFLSHAPAGASVRQVAHYGQVIRRGVFARFHYNMATNLLRYGRLTPPEYDVSRVRTPAFLYYGLADTLVDHRDLLTLASRLADTRAVHKLARDSFNHYDFIWADRAKEELYHTVIANLKSLD